MHSSMLISLASKMSVIGTMTHCLKKDINYISETVPYVLQSAPVLLFNSFITKKPN